MSVIIKRIIIVIEKLLCWFISLIFIKNNSYLFLKYVYDHFLIETGIILISIDANFKKFKLKELVLYEYLMIICLFIADHLDLL